MFMKKNMKKKVKELNASFKAYDKKSFTQVIHLY